MLGNSETIKVVCKSTVWQPEIARFGFQTVSRICLRHECTLLHPMRAYTHIRIRIYCRRLDAGSSWFSGGKPGKGWTRRRSDWSRGSHGVAAIDRGDASVNHLPVIIKTRIYYRRRRERYGRTDTAETTLSRLTTTGRCRRNEHTRNAYASSRALRRRLTDACGRTRQPVWCRSDERWQRTRITTTTMTWTRRSTEKQTLKCRALANLKNTHHNVILKKKKSKNNDLSRRLLVFAHLFYATEKRLSTVHKFVSRVC